MNTDFTELATALRNTFLMKTEAIFVAQKQQWLADFAGHFTSVCTEIVKAQSKSSIPAISRIEYTMLYSNFIERSEILGRK